jgi:hypothetical protein
MKTLDLKVIRYLLIAIVVVPVTIVSHELGHFFSYLCFGGEDVRLLAFSVSAETKHLSPGQLAISSMAGPLISYVTILAAALMTVKHYSSFWVLLAIAAPIGRIVNGVYIYFRALGYQPNPNFDEYNFSRSIGIEPLIVCIPTMLIVVATFFWFGRLAWKEGGVGELLLVVFSVLFGLGVWSQIGPWFLA